MNLPRRIIPRRVERGDQLAERLARRLDRPVGALGVVFVLIVSAQLVITDATWSRTLQVLGWVFWVVFACEFALRAYIARDQARFWRRNWWQLAFLAVPFLRLFRGLALLRTTRVAGVLTSTVRGSRSARRLLTGRIAWLGLVTLVVIMGSSQLLFAGSAYRHYGEALHGAALAAITGEPLAADGTLARGTEIGLAVYSVVVFATLAGSLGAFFLGRQRVNSSGSKLASPLGKE